MNYHTRQPPETIERKHNITSGDKWTITAIILQTLETKRIQDAYKIESKLPIYRNLYMILKAKLGWIRGTSFVQL